MKHLDCVTPSMRHTVLISHSLLSKWNLNMLKQSLVQHGGRNNTGKITIRHHGHHHRRKSRLLFNDNLILSNMPIVIKMLPYDPTRSSFLMLLRSLNGLWFYRIAYKGSLIDHVIYYYNTLPYSTVLGDRVRLKFISNGSIIHDVKKISCAAGSKSILLKKNNRVAYVKLPSLKILKFSSLFLATLGMVSNKNNKYTNIGKAGRNRWLGIRPTVRGVCMNPVDHPHGGGEGHKSKKVTPRTPWGKLSSGQKIKRNKVYYD